MFFSSIYSPGLSYSVLMDYKINKREHLDVKFPPVTKTFVAMGVKRNWVKENDKCAVNLEDEYADRLM